MAKIRRAAEVRKSTDGLGVMMWWFDNGWRVVRSPDRPHSYRVETSDHFSTYSNLGTLRGRNALYRAKRRASKM